MVCFGNRILSLLTVAFISYATGCNIRVETRQSYVRQLFVPYGHALDSPTYLRVIDKESRVVVTTVLENPVHAIRSCPGNGKGGCNT